MTHACSMYTYLQRVIMIIIIVRYAKENNIYFYHVMMCYYVMLLVLRTYTTYDVEVHCTLYIIGADEKRKRSSNAQCDRNDDTSTDFLM